ncbi:hypothetical protein LDENG_00292400 [Lucifuga dentata]|nr:hypothetical protein LDENG_00292400 [Lucifuga dentata]
MLFSKNKTVSSDAVDMFKRQAKCLQMPSPIMINPNYEMCPDTITPTEGLSAINTMLEAKMPQKIARLMDHFFDMFIN